MRPGFEHFAALSQDASPPSRGLCSIQNQASQLKHPQALFHPRVHFTEFSTEATHGHTAHPLSDAPVDWKDGGLLDRCPQCLSVKAEFPQ